MELIASLANAAQPLHLPLAVSLAASIGGSLILVIGAAWWIFHR